MRRFADFEAFNLWASTVVERIRGSKRVQARPAGSPKGPGELAMPVLCLRCVASAAASGTGHCPARPAAGCGALSTDFQTAKYPEAPIYGRQIRMVPAAASGCRHGRPAAAAKGTRGACDCSPRPPWISLPLQTRSRGSALREIRSCQASFWQDWETRHVQLNHEISSCQLPQAKCG